MATLAGLYSFYQCGRIRRAQNFTELWHSALTKAGRVGVSVSEIGLDKLPARQEELTVKTDTVASLRMDAALSAAFGLSRTKAAELIAVGRVNLDHQLCLQPAKELGESALLSVSGLGRAKLLETGGLSRKGRIFVRVGLYGR